MHSSTTPEQMARAARRASRAMARASTAQKDQVLRALAASLVREAPRILEENARDVREASSLSASMQDRLKLDDARLAALARAVEDVAALPDPVGSIERLAPQPSGIVVGRMQVPLGVVLIVYESRPNVTVDAASLCLKAGNAVILRGGKEALHTNRALASLVGDALFAAGLPKDAALFVDDTDRDVLYALLRQSRFIDLAIPRGGTSLIDAVNQHARVPVIQHYQGICHVYVHERADLDAARRIAVNAKVQRPGVCNAMECLLVDEAVAAAFLPGCVAELQGLGVEVRGCDKTRALAPGCRPAVDEDWDTEFLDLRLAVKVVAGYADAVGFIAEHGTRHTEAIVTADHDVAMGFLRDVDASCVLINASTRFNDGGELGLGAELGISTTKLHAYGPMGLDELCARKFVVLGHGETRGAKQ